MTAEELRRMAFCWSGGSLSLAVLRDGMLRLVTWLTGEAGIRPGDRVAICLPKSPEALLAMYGILSAGATYVPLQFQGPSDRLTSILTSVRPRLLMTTQAMTERLAAPKMVPLLAIELREDGTGLEPILAGLQPRSAVVEVGPDDLAWLVFTSGSTGEPKGVMLSHRNMATNIDWMQRRDRMSERDLRISHSGLHYVASSDQLFPMGSAVRIFLLDDREAMFPDRVAEAIERERSTIWSSRATALRLLAERGGLEGRDLGAMRRISFYGEPMPMSVLRRLMVAFPTAEFSNHYGATEVNNIANYEVPRPLPENLTVLPLGRPPDHCTVTLRDESGGELGVGEAGEICAVSGVVSPGYWEDPVLTASKRFDGRSDSFRTGDLGMIGADGLLHSIGRMDQMVKIRGHRFDLGEIEAAIKAHPDVRDAAAFAFPTSQGETELRAAALSRRKDDLVADLRLHCVAKLPTFARPAHFLPLEEFPLLSTGKIDRRALKALLSTVSGGKPTA